MTSTEIHVRPVVPSDAPALLAIYAPLVERTTISFELTPPTLAEFEARIVKCVQRWAWLVAESKGEALGYAYGSLHRERLAYRWSTETSAYVLESARGTGVGTRLYAALLPQLAAIGYCNAYAGIALPNDASVALHRRAGFAPIGVFPAVGRKFGAWHDVAWMHARLRETPPAD